MIALLLFLLIVLISQISFTQTLDLSHYSHNEQSNTFKALVFSKTAGFRHSSIPDGISAIQQLGVENNFLVDTTEDASKFNNVTLSQYQAVIFLNTTGDILNGEQQTAFEEYIQGGGGYVGIHSASDTEYDWKWYGNLVGAYFQSHPAIQSATIIIADKFHPSTESLPERWFRTDEWYNFQANPRENVHVLATLDENTYSGGENGYDHPISWCHQYDGGRAWYTALGHTEESYTEQLFLQHILGGILFSAGVAEGDCGATIDSYFEKIILDDNTYDPMSLAVTPDGKVFYVQRTGEVKAYNPADSNVTIIGDISVTTLNEDGLLGIALDPNFENNNWVYLFYSPEGSEPKQHVSRFTLVDNQLDMNSEKILLVIPTQRQQCCHSAGSLAFGPNGNLFISTGDNTNPFESGGYNPIDERPGRSHWDAQKSASNTNDLRGKILRITPQADGTYTIPEGNLFSPGDSVRPEIFIMGCRNPFRISVDSTNGWLYWGEVGPDAGTDNSSRGPKGYDEWNQAREPGNYGWPYCIADNKSYIDFDFSSGTSGLPFDCDNPVNNSPNNTGSLQLPISKPALIWYPYDASPEFPELETGGRTAMAGPVYYFNPDLNSQNKLPKYYDNTLFVYEWSRRWIKEVKLDNAGNVLKINPFLDSFEFIRPMDMEMGPDGSLYILEWGTNFWGGNSDSKLVNIKYNKEGPSVDVQPEFEIKNISSFSLSQNYPNPFNPITSINYELPVNTEVELNIYNLLGQKIAELVSKQQPAGNYKVEWDASVFTSGIYFYRLKTNAGFVQTKKLILLK